MAEARAAIVAPKVPFHDKGTSQIEQEKEVAKSFFQTVKICAFRTRKQIANGVWPTTLDHLAIAAAMIGCSMAIDHPKLNIVTSWFWLFGEYLHLDASYPYVARLLLISVICSVIYFVIVFYARQLTLRFLLSYKGWLYETPRSLSWTTKIWSVLVRIVSGPHPRLFSFQNSLARMSVPPLDSTIKGFLLSVKELMSEEEYLRIKGQAKDFRSSIGPKLQTILHLKSWWAANYYSDWWEKYVYLMGRSSLSTNSNFYGLDQRNWVPTSRQASRAAGIVTFFLDFHKKLLSEEVEPLLIRGTIPLCMGQYERLFGTTRIPCHDIDELRTIKDAEHIVICANGQYYKLNINDAHGKELCLLDVESQFEWIIEDSRRSYNGISSMASSIPALTAGERNGWADIRRLHFGQGTNKSSLELMEDALFHVVLVDKKFDVLEQRAKYLLHGDGKSIWFDKNFTLMVFNDGRCGLNVEHSFADAPVIAHAMEYAMTHEYLFRTYNDNGHCKPYGGLNSPPGMFARSKALITPQRLYWDVSPELETLINDAYHFAVKNNDDLALRILEFTEYGKGFIKAQKISPDAFIQCALQLAYCKDADGKFALTYESCMTRLFLQGRTETVRSFSAEVKAFVLAMRDPLCPNAERIRLLRLAAEKHQVTYRDCMAGKGIDRHLFSLYVVAKGQGYESPFLQSALSLPWTLSTSQQPQQQMQKAFDLGLPQAMDSIGPGGGFGPVADDGYGVAYMIPNDNMFFFHISSKVSSQATDSSRFASNLVESFRDMHTIFTKS